MKITIIDNHTSHIEELLSLLQVHELEVFSYQENRESLMSGNIVILSGGHDTPLELHHDVYQKEIAFVQQSTLPIFGICLGFQII